MAGNARRIEILEREIEAICGDVGLENADADWLLQEFESGGEIVRQLSAPVGEALWDLLVMRRHALSKER